MTRARKYSFASLVAIGFAMPAFAQTPEAPQPAPQTAPAESESRDVVIITANKRAESVQDVAVAVTAITSEQKEEFGIISVTDLTNITPGLSYTPGNERVTLRGIGRQTNGFGADPGVANYNDGIYTAFAVFAGKEPILIDRVEVLRGPQGTLYGRNSIGGAINTISKRPTDEFALDFVLGGGNYEARKVGVAVSGPVTDWLRYRAVGFRETREGIDPNYGSRETEGWEIDDTNLEFQLEGDIGDRFTWWLKAVEYTYDKAGPPGGRTATFSTAPFITSGVFTTATSSSPVASWAFSGAPTLISFDQIGNRRDNPFATSREHAYNVNQPATALLPQYDEYITEAVYSFDNFDIKYTGGYTFYDYRLRTDADGTSVRSINYRAGADGLPNAAGAPRTIGTDLRNEYKESRAFFSNELNFISTNDAPLQWILGLYQYQENNDQSGLRTTLVNEPGAHGVYQMNDGSLQAGGKPLSLARNQSLQNSYGAYGRTDYTLNDQWKFSLGLRYSYDIKDVAEQGFQNCYIVCRGAAALIPGGLAVFTQDLVNTTPLVYANPAVPTGYSLITYSSDGYALRRLKNQWSAVTGDLGAEFRPLDDTLLFAKYSKGYKAGAVNTGFALDPFADAERVDVYEGGWKQEWVDWGLTTNAALFFYNYTDMQATVTRVLNQGVAGQERTVGELANIPEATSAGFELESNWSPIDALNIGFTYSYLQTEITEGGGTYIDSSRDTRCLGPGNALVACSATATTYADPLSRVTLEGHSLPQSPEHKFAVNASYRFEFEDGSSLLPTVSYYWRDKFYDTIFNATTEEAPSQEQADARVTWRSPNERFAVIGWVRNLFDAEQTTSVASQTFRTADNGRYQTFSYTPPRMWGVDLQFHY